MELHHYHYAQLNTGRACSACTTRVYTPNVKEILGRITALHHSAGRIGRFRNAAWSASTGIWECGPRRDGIVVPKLPQRRRRYTLRQYSRAGDAIRPQTRAGGNLPQWNAAAWLVDTLAGPCRDGRSNHCVASAFYDGDTRRPRSRLGAQLGSRNCRTCVN